MESQILIPTETTFELPTRNVTAGQLEMSAFETHLRKWDSNLGHAIATDPGATMELTWALDAFKDEEEHHQPEPSSTSSHLGAPSSNPPLAARSGSPLLPLGPLTSPSLSPSTTKVSSSGTGSGAHSSLGMTVRSDSRSKGSPNSQILPPSSGEGGSIGAGSGKGSSQNDGSIQSHWGTPFRVRWYAIRGLPFTSTRKLRNPWNRDREVKVSRDGTELEPSVGRDLLELWDFNGPSSDSVPPVSPSWPQV